MSVGIGAAVRAGARRTASRGGLALVLVFVAVGFVAMVGTQSLLRGVFEPALETLRSQPAQTEFTASEVRQFAAVLDASTPFALTLPAWAAGGLIVLAGLVREALRIVAIRVFATETAGHGGSRLRPLVLPTLNGVAGGVAVWFLVGLGGVLGILAIVVGGVVAALFLATSFLFVRQVIAVEGRNFVDALNESWRIASGHRLHLLALGAVVVVLTAVAVTVARIAGGVLVGPSVAWVAWLGCRGVTAVFGIATITHAYGELRAESRGADTDPAEDDRTGIY